MPQSVHAQSKAPHIVATCAANLIAGTAQLISGDTPASIYYGTPDHVDTLWSILLVVGGLAGLIGIFWKDPILGLRLEAAGHVGIFGGSGVYAIALIAWIDSPWWPQIALWWAIALSIASAARWCQIVTTIRRASREAEGAK